MALIYRLKSLNKKLAILLATSSIPLNLLEDPDLIAFLNEMNPKFPVPGRKKGRNLIETEYNCLRFQIGKCLESAGKVSVCVDLWSRRNLTATYCIY